MTLKGVDSKLDEFLLEDFIKTHISFVFLYKLLIKVFY